jgi:hypothetical protein
MGQFVRPWSIGSGGSGKLLQLPPLWVDSGRPGAGELIRKSDIRLVHPEVCDLARL